MVNVILEFLMKITDFFLLPIDLIITNALPDIASFMANITQFLNIPLQASGFVLSLVNFPIAGLEMILTYMLFKFAVIQGTAGIKWVMDMISKYK